MAPRLRCHSLWSLFQPSVEPVEEGALPEDTVLGFQHPVVLVREDEQFCLDAFHTGGIEGRHTLRGIDAVVLFTMDAEDGGVPFVDKQMR